MKLASGFKILFRLLLFLLLSFSFGACATVFGGKKNTISVMVGNPEKAEVYLDGVFLGETPLKIRISKYKLQHGSLLEIRKEGYQTQKFEVVRSPHLLYVAADILTGALPLLVDAANGNIYRPNTRNLKYELIPVGEATENKEVKP